MHGLTGVTSWKSYIRSQSCTVSFHVALFRQRSTFEWHPSGSLKPRLHDTFTLVPYTTASVSRCPSAGTGRLSSVQMFAGTGRRSQYIAEINKQQIMGSSAYHKQGGHYVLRRFLYVFLPIGGEGCSAKKLNMLQ